ncbi:MAG: phosphoglycerate dehydrogenase [Nitrospinota bacterium]|nr:phosphoglycerate dehydrogenase [Nitrospinota bacterium]
MKVLVSDKLAPEGVKLFEEAEGIEVVVKTGMTKEELIAEIPSYDGLVIRSATKVTADVLDAAKNLKVIGRAGIGVDNVDLEAAGKKGVVVMNTPEGNTITTAEHAISLMMSMARKIPQAHALLKKGEWSKKLMGVEIYNKTLGVIGLGKIGSIVARRGLGLSMKVIAYDPFVSAEYAQTMGIELVELEELYKRADFITVHVPKTEKTANLIGEKEFGMMKPTARLINCARGGIVNEAALIKAVKEKKIAGAALDVYDKEPLPEDNPLREVDDIIMTPHLGASTDEAQVNVAIDIAGQIIDMLQNGQIRNSVNAPSVSADMLKKLRPYIDLADKLGCTISQLVEGGIKEINITYSGDIAKLDRRPVTVSLLKGFLQVFAGEGLVNMVNAPYFAKERGIKVTESTTSEVTEFKNTISVVVTTDKMTRRLDGCVFLDNVLRIVRVDDYWIEASLSEYMLFISNKDLTGVIGKIGGILGDNKVNIAGMHLGRDFAGGEAISIINVDSEATEKTLESLKALPYVNYVTMVKL